eukprot:1158300-Pelagomonas_calceolata.AAC.8
MVEDACTDVRLLTWQLMMLHSQCRPVLLGTDSGLVHEIVVDAEKWAAKKEPHAPRQVLDLRDARKEVHTIEQVRHFGVHWEVHAAYHCVHARGGCHQAGALHAPRQVLDLPDARKEVHAIGESGCPSLLRIVESLLLEIVSIKEELHAFEQ